MAKRSGGAKTTLRYRDAKSGHFLTDKQGQQMKPENVVRERVPKPGRGDTK